MTETLRGWTAIPVSNIEGQSGSWFVPKESPRQGRFKPPFPGKPRGLMLCGQHGHKRAALHAGQS